jgi:UDPglucose 6-dehydrogenase
LNYCRDVYEAAQGVDAIVLLTEWKEFQQVDWARLANVVERPLLVDGRNFLRCEEVTSHGFQYLGIGGVAGAPALIPAIANVEFSSQVNLRGSSSERSL